VVDGAERALRDYLAKHPNASAQDIADLIADLTETGYEVDTELAAALYNGLRAAHPELPAYSAVISANVIERQYILKAVESALSLSGETSYIDRLVGSMSRWIMQGARDTIRDNAKSDSIANNIKVRWARVPQGTNTCGFCIMLASRGFVYHTEETAGGFGNQYHNDCDCLPIPGFEGDTLEGYDPDSYYAIYEAMKDSSKVGAFSWNTLMGSHFDTSDVDATIRLISPLE